MDRQPALSLHRHNAFAIGANWRRGGWHVRRRWIGLDTHQPHHPRRSCCKQSAACHHRRGRCGLCRHPVRLAYRPSRFSGTQGIRVAADTSDCDACLCDGLCVHGHAAVRGPAARRAAHDIWLAGKGGLLVSGHSFIGRCGDHADVRALSLRLCVGARRVCRTVNFAHRGGPHVRLWPLRHFLARFTAAGAPGDRGRHGAGADGNTGRLRHRFLLRRFDLYDGHF